MTNLAFSKNLKALRNQRNLTQEQMAEKCEVTRQAIAKWEREDSEPKISIIPILCKTFSVSADELLFESKAGTNSDLEEIKAELKKIKDMLQNKKEDLYKQYLQNKLNFEGNEYADVMYDLGCTEMEKGNYSEALKYLDGAIARGHIDAILVALKVFLEILDILYIDDKTETLYVQTLADMGEKMQMNGLIMKDSIS